MELLSVLILSACFSFVIAVDTQGDQHGQEAYKPIYYGKKCISDQDCGDYEANLYCSRETGNCSCRQTEHWQVDKCRLIVGQHCRISENRCVLHGTCKPHEIPDKYGEPIYHSEEGTCKCDDGYNDHEKAICNGVGRHGFRNGLGVLILTIIPALYRIF